MARDDNHDDVSNGCYDWASLILLCLPESQVNGLYCAAGGALLQNPHAGGPPINWMINLDYSYPLEMM